MQITYDALMLGKPTIIKDKQFLATKDYVEPFFEFFKPLTDNFEIHVELPDQVTGSIDAKDITYNKVWCQAVLPLNTQHYDPKFEYNEVYGLIYSLDTKVPEIKYYRAYQHKTFKNLSVFEPTWIQSQELKPEVKYDYNFKELLGKPDTFSSKLKNIKNTFIKPNDLTSTLGNLIEKSLLYEYQSISSKVQIASKDIVKAYRLVTLKPTSNYYVDSSTEGSLHNFYSAVCSQITEGKDIIYRFEKTILVGMLFGIINYESNNKTE